MGNTITMKIFSPYLQLVPSLVMTQPMGIIMTLSFQVDFMEMKVEYPKLSMKILMH